MHAHNLVPKFNHNELFLKFWPSSLAHQSCASVASYVSLQSCSFDCVLCADSCLWLISAVQLLFLSSHSICSPFKVPEMRQSSMWLRYQSWAIRTATNTSEVGSGRTRCAPAPSREGSEPARWVTNGIWSVILPCLYFKFFDSFVIMGKGKGVTLKQHNQKHFEKKGFVSYLDLIFKNIWTWTCTAFISTVRMPAEGLRWPAGMPEPWLLGPGGRDHPHAALRTPGPTQHLYPCVGLRGLDQEGHGLRLEKRRREILIIWCYHVFWGGFFCFFMSAYFIKWWETVAPWLVSLIWFAIKITAHIYKLSFHYWMIPFYSEITVFNVRF